MQAIQFQHVPLVEATRGDLTESVHYGSFAVVDAGGTLRSAAGSPEAPYYARSSLKPFQSTAMVRAGLQLPPRLLALSSASHSGAPVHIEGAREILSMHGLDETALRNALDLPYGAKEREAWLRGGGEPTQITQNCSGKHAAMLATCVVNDWSRDDYLSPEHPLQRLVKQTVEEFTGEESAADTVDGCGTPLFAFSLTGLAHAAARLGAADPASAEGSVFSAIQAHPDMLAGEQRDVTALMRSVPSLIAKDGAEGFQLVALRSGVGVAIKISDGGDRARMPITLAILRELGVAEAELADVPLQQILGGGAPRGVLRTLR
ncbi:asparaginase [Leucobacter insecticola]|uniref:Asparaginase n=1 Tax=Leucobacter insecticola TaxID=2714934 RepID=A0A6G8FJC4_9MICO|nr:asparaginase [Leucobacter insecticola]QIM16451.1 asparaginase [Leucobacter insecticola]